ncbi:MAG: hypothetical protein C5B44_03355, partial [Acidobacteria bacterium]
MKEVNNYLPTLRQKWSEVPAGGDKRITTETLLSLSDNDLLTFWNDVFRRDTEGEGFNIRGWYHCLYTDFLKEKSVLDVGSGLGISTIAFARAGAHVTFVDIHQTNLAVIERLCGILKISSVSFLYLDALQSLETLPYDFDVITAIGSMHHAPFEIIKAEAAELIKHLKINGRWLQFAYPKSRWQKEGSPQFEDWGNMTDGLGTPYAEWYDTPKLLSLLAPAQLDLVFYYEWHNQDFNWFDLVL